MEPFLGILIRKERLKQNLSQEGLCKGICVVSYVSKIEKGQADASPEIISALLQRLGISYETDPSFLKQAQTLIGQLYEKLYSYTLKEEDLREIRQENSRYLSSKYMLDALLLLCSFPEAEAKPAPRLAELQEYAPCMSKRQYELYLYYLCWEGKEPFDKLLKLTANSFFLIQAGVWHWTKGDYMQAAELLSKGYSAACEEGNVYNMLEAKAILGNCYSSMDSPGSREMMMRQYQVAERIAQALGAEACIQDIYYNIAATSLERGETDLAEAYFQKCTSQSIWYYHKYAICKEKQGKRKEALALLLQGREKIPNEPGDVSRELEEIYDVVEYRLRHEGYQEDPQYETLLRTCMKHLGKRFPKSYQKFHVPFLIEVLERQRKYKEICEWMREFPG
ncbi:MAG: helix-turn-helix transcriptional regulator [Lachnospiraceae bacterium]|nr:helix-turn-helix transcriptional regulator [Lachnospiraceae bacterium]